MAGSRAGAGKEQDEPRTFTLCQKIKCSKNRGTCPKDTIMIVMDYNPLSKIGNHEGINK